MGYKYFRYGQDDKINLLRKDEGYELGSIKENPDGTYTQRILEVF